MRKVALVFVLAVFVPSLVLAWLAVRSLRDEQLALERQQTLLCQSIADALAKEAADFLDQRQREFAQQVESLLGKREPVEVADRFDDTLRAQWPLAEVGFAVSLEGSVLSPSLFSRPDARNFRLQNDRFLCNRESVEVYWANPKGQGNFTLNDDKARNDIKFAAQNQAVLPVQQPQQVPATTEQSVENSLGTQGGYFNKSQKRSVTPQKDSNEDQQQLSKVASSEAEFRQLIGEANDGALARFLQNKLKLMFWHRSARDPQLVFGAQLDLDRLTEGLRAVAKVEAALAQEICVALLDDSARPIAVSHPGFQTNWRRPFVATEIGEALPHWEVAVYLLDPAKITRTAATLRATLGLLVAVLVLAISLGGWLIFRELQRELVLARQKTDFVSNVSHELKTPLTSIRMFAELLAEGRVSDEVKRRSYLQIITAEAARLTRLINNVLDFSRMERGEKKYSFQPCDLASVMREIVESYRPHLESNGFKFECELPEAPVPVSGDRDALAQVLVNLLSNAEKYSADGCKEITVRLRRQSEPVAFAELSVLDRGVGVPKGSEARIFEQFYRAHDALSSGIQGSGLGLTLARQIARAHGGDIAYAPREGGGSCFALRLPMRAEHD